MLLSTLEMFLMPSLKMRRPFVRLNEADQTDGAVSSGARSIVKVITQQLNSLVPCLDSYSILKS